jgi:hypothetical protein
VDEEQVCKLEGRVLGADSERERKRNSQLRTLEIFYNDVHDTLYSYILGNFTQTNPVESLPLDASRLHDLDVEAGDSADRAENGGINTWQYLCKSRAASQFSTICHSSLKFFDSGTQYS